MENEKMVYLEVQESKSEEAKKLLEENNIPVSHIWFEQPLDVVINNKAEKTLDKFIKNNDHVSVSEELQKEIKNNIVNEFLADDSDVIEDVAFDIIINAIENIAEKQKRRD